MNARLLELAERRATLTARAAAQRAALARQLAPWRVPLAVVDQGVAAVRYLKSHPELLAGIAVFVAVIRPRRVMGWLRSGWMVWRIVRVVKQRLPGG